jgi:hypothetical protein
MSIELAKDLTMLILDALKMPLPLQLTVRLCRRKPKLVYAS